MKKSTDSWNKIRDLRHTLIQYLLQQNRFGTGEDETIEREEDVRRHVGGMPLLTDLSLAMRIDPLALIRGVTEFVTVIYGPAVTFAFPDVKVEAYRRSVLHLNLISAVDGSTLNWCEQHALRELMSEDLLFAKISEPEMTVINFDDHFCDRMGEVERGHIEVFPKLWNLRPYDKTNGEMIRVPRLTAAYHKVREETKDWGDYKKLPEAIPEFPLIRRMLLGAVSVVQTPRLRAFETNERRAGNFSVTMDPCFVGRNAAVLQYTRFAYTDQATRRRISNAATPKPGRFDEEWRELGLAPMRMRGRTKLPEASLILTSVRKEMKVGGVLQTRTFLAPFGCEEIKVVHGEEEDKSAGTLLIPRFQEEADNDEQGPSSSNKDKSEGDDGQGGSRQTEEPMQQDQAGGEDDRASTGGTSSLDFNIFSDLENNADTLETTEPADEGISTLEPPSAFEEMKRNLPESSSPGNSRNNDQRILMESPRRRRIEASARVPFLGTLPEEEWEVHHRDHETRTGCKLDRVAFMEEVWTVIQSYGTQSILKTGLNQPLMREVLDKLDECEGRLSELLIDSATDESEANSPIKMTPQDNEGEVVYLSRTRRGTMRSKMVIDKINAMKMKLGSRVMPRRIGKTKVDSEISMKAGNSAKRKRVEEVMDLGQGDYQLSGTDRILTDIAMVPPILMAGIKSTGYKSKRSDRTLTGATLEMEILSQCGESKMRDFKPSPMNHGKGSVAGQLTPVEYNRLTVSETVSIDEPTGGYMEMLEYRNSARGYVMALEDEKAMEGYLEMMLQGTTLKQKAYGTLASSDVEAETIEQLVSLPWKAVVLRYFEEEMRTTPRIHALVAVPYVRTELQLRLAWCMMGLTREEYDSEERKRSKEEKVFLMTNLRDLIVQEGAAVACAKRRDALCFIRFLIEQISVPALSTCVKMLKEGDERTKATFLLAMLDMQQSKPMRVNMKEPEELEPMKKIDEIRRFSNKELRLTKESMGALPKSSEYCGPIKKKSYSYVSGIIGIAYNPFLSEDIRDCFFDYEQAVLLRFWTSRIVTNKSVNNPQAKLGLVLEEEVTAPSVPKSDKRVEFGLGFSDELLRTSLMAVWELMKPSWCPSPNADSILRATQDIQRELNADCNLRDLNIIYNVMITASKSNGEDKVELPGWGPEDWVKPGSCLAEVCGLEGHVCGSLDCVKTLEKQHKQLTVLFGNVVMKARTETELIADCHGGTDVNLVTALGFYSMYGSLESLLNLEQKHEMVTAISVEVFPGVLQTEQKYIGKWREAIETEMNIRHSETYCRPSGARYLVGSTLAPMCKSRYPVHFVAVDVKSTRTIVDQAFSVPKCVRLARMSEKSYELLCKMFSAVPERTKEELESILGKKFMGYVSGNFSDFEKQKQRGSTVTDYNAVDENDEIHRVMMEVEPLLEASGKRNWRSIMLTHDEFPCHCLLQTWWYPKRSNLVLIWDSGELLSMGLPDSSQPITIVIVGVMMAIRWLEAHVRENNRQEAPTREQLQKLDCLKDLDLFETMCKVLNIPMEVKKIWARKRLMPWFRANMTAWLYEYAKKHMSKHGRVYSEYQLDIGAGAFKRAFVTHRNAVTTAVKRISRTSERSGNEKAEMLKEDLERNVTLCLHNSFCRNRESNVDPLPCCKQRVEEQKCWRTASNSVRIVNDVLQDKETESAESVSQEEEMEH